jgi:hypothetical protein
MPESLLVEQQRANELILGIDDPILREAASLLFDGVMQYHNADRSRLRGSFDLAFLAEIVEYDIANMAKLLHKAVPWGYWEEPGTLPDRPEPRPVDPSAENGPIWLRIGQAENYCWLHKDRWVGEILFRLFNYAKLKHEVMIKKTRHYAPEPISGATPMAPLDLLFMVMAMDYALQPGQPARKLLKQSELPQSA